MFWVYILQCSDNSYYTGHTDNLEARLYQHYHKIFPTCYTATRLPVKLAYSAQFPSRIEALEAEKQIKKRKKKKRRVTLTRGEKKYSSSLVRKKKKNSCFFFLCKIQPFETRA